MKSRQKRKKKKTSEKRQQQLVVLSLILAILNILDKLIELISKALTK